MTGPGARRADGNCEFEVLEKGCFERCLGDPVSATVSVNHLQRERERPERVWCVEVKQRRPIRPSLAKQEVDTSMYLANNYPDWTR